MEQILPLVGPSQSSGASKGKVSRWRAHQNTLERPRSGPQGMLPSLAFFRQPFHMYCTCFVSMSYVFYYTLVYLLYLRSGLLRPRQSQRRPDSWVKSAGGRLDMQLWTKWMLRTASDRDRLLSSPSPVSIADFTQDADSALGVTRHLTGIATIPTCI